MGLIIIKIICLILAFLLISSYILTFCLRDKAILTIFSLELQRCKGVRAIFIYKINDAEFRFHWLCKKVTILASLYSALANEEQVYI